MAAAALQVPALPVPEESEGTAQVPRPSGVHSTSVIACNSAQGVIHALARRWHQNGSSYVLWKPQTPFWGMVSGRRWHCIVLLATKRHVICSLELLCCIGQDWPSASASRSWCVCVCVCLQVELYAEYAPEQLLPFLQSSKQYIKEAALQVCKDRDLVREQVFILGRLNRAGEALQLIISTLHDLPQAIDFVSSHPELWDELLRLVVRDADLTGELLDTVCCTCLPLKRFTWNSVLWNVHTCDLHTPSIQLLKALHIHNCRT